MISNISSKNINKIMNVVAIYIGVTLIAMGVTEMNDSNYVPPETPAGWIMGMAWIIAGGIIATTWFLFVSSDVIAQKLNAEKRWTFSTMVTISLVLILAAGCAILGTWHTWKHPYSIGECMCTEDQWGLFCKPCECVNGACHSGMYGTGVCACDLGWTGDKCDRCDDRHKPEPDGDEPACNLCKTGFVGDKCQFCDVGYTGDECDTCDTGWHPWQYASPLFPKTISDDNRHICDECIPNHWGYYCKPCPLGNDVPHKTLAKNNPLVIGETRVADKLGARGVLHAIETCSLDTTTKTCTTWTTGAEYDVNNPFILEHVRVQIRYDSDDAVSRWLLMKQVGGFECNNRGTCRDDLWHQANNLDWDKTCTKTYIQECTSHSDCKMSENCRGTCQPLELPINPIWSKWNGESGRMCADDDDCRGDPISEDEDGNLIYYTGGRCISRFCCDESYHGDGTCDCNATYFGPPFGPGIKPHQELSPACDFCPGYDFESEESDTICSGGYGTCAASFASALEANTLGAYLNMRCICGSTVYIDPDTGIVDPTVVIQWQGEFCECGDSDNDGECDFCSAGHWGPECKMCPGGAGARACSGHGTCSSDVLGDGTCTCDVDRSSSWMLSDYVPRFEGDCADCGNPDIPDGTKTCNECAPNFWGEGCWRCDDTDMIKASELDDVFQPQGSFHMGLGQSTLLPHPVCHPQQPWLCTLACGGGGWCDWGRRGTGNCKCWSNRREDERTWNPLDNVCIGNDRYDPTGSKTFQRALEDGAMEGKFMEQCPSNGYCSTGSTSRDIDLFTQCGREDFIGDDKNMSLSISEVNWSPAQDWGGNTEACVTGTCYVWRSINWELKRSLISCRPD